MSKMNQWTPLWSMIVESSLWQDEDDATCKVFVTMLAIKDPDHIVRMSAYQIGKKSNKTEAQVLAALKILAAPDKKRLEPQEFEGRRIEKVDAGWLVLNGPKYQEMMQEMIRQRDQARWQREERMIFRALRTGEGISPDKLTPNIKARFEKAKKKYAASAPRKNGNTPAFTHDDPTGETGTADVNSRFGFDPQTEPPKCHAMPGEACRWKDCPQIRDNEPETSNRDCPLATEWEAWASRDDLKREKQYEGDK